MLNTSHHNGQGLPEYIIILAVIALILLPIVLGLSGTIRNEIENFRADIDNSGG